MIGGWLPWRRLLPVWLPAVLLCVVAVALWVWQTSGTIGREAQLRTAVSDLETSIGRLQNVRAVAAGDRTTVAELDEEIRRIYSEVFGSAEERLTNILREVERAAREAQMLPDQFGYSADQEESLDCVVFGISFAVTGHYEQIRRMLGILQSSPEFLTIDSISFKGEDDPTTREVRIAVRLNTYLAEQDPERLLRLTGAGGGTDG